MHYACIIGNNHEWPEQRSTHGDIALARCLTRHCLLPKNRLVELYDESATRSNVLYCLEKLLSGRNASEEDVLLFYYGGHGKREEVCTFAKSLVNGKVQKEPWLRYEEIIDLLERNFQGGTVWVILDCCHSGGFGEAVMERYYDNDGVLNVNYGCVMSVPPGDIAGMEWTITECFIRAFRGELLCGGKGARPYYLSTRKGKHRVSDELLDQEPEVDVLNSQPLVYPTWGQVIEFLSDEMGRIKGDQLTTLFIGDQMSDGTYLNRPCMFGDQILAACDTGNEELDSMTSIPRDTSWMDTFACNTYSINDAVYLKLNGLANKQVYNAGNKTTHQVGWLPGRITFIGDKMVTINIHDVITGTSWTVEVTINDDSATKKTIMSGLPFGFHMRHQACVTAVAHFAKQLCYLDTSLLPYTRVQILWSDGEFYPGYVMSPTELNWGQVKEHEVDDDYNEIGPYVAVQWEEEDTTSLVPLGKCVVIDQIHRKLNKKELVAAQKYVENNSRKAMKSIQTPMDAMLASLSCSGKKLHSKETPVLQGIDLTEQDSSEWEAYDAEDKEFLPVQIMHGHIAKLPLEVFAYHMCYPQLGDFSVVFWEDDSVLSLVPSTFLRLRSEDGDESSTESCDSSNVEECEELNTDYSVSDSSWNTTIVQFGLLSVSFWIGCLVGRRTKAR